MTLKDALTRLDYHIAIGESWAPDDMLESLKIAREALREKIERETS